MPLFTDPLNRLAFQAHTRTAFFVFVMSLTLGFLVMGAHC